VEEEAEAVVIGSAEEASVAVARMLAVTQATYERRAQLEHALESRIAIEQAKGIIAERYGLDLEDAFAIIRRAARTHRVKIRDLASCIRPRAPLPREIEAVLHSKDV
jgi:AmiR/NasT family two-component response regulator